MPKCRVVFSRILLLTWGLLSGNILFAQFFSGGESPASFRWRQIRTENFQVIYPEDYESQAVKVANMLEWAYEHASASLHHQPRKISVIIHNHTVVSNGFVSWAPRRMELFTNPPAGNDFHHWMDRLVIHEFRHVVQIDKLNQGLTRILGILLGEAGTGAVVAHIPMWFIEGDAISVETAMTRAGRGRLPWFEQGLRAQILEKGLYSYDKAVLGSFRDHVPNYYELGYQMVAAARVWHGAEVWSPVVDNVARRPWGLIPFSAGLRRQTGSNTKGHYHNTFAFLDSVWNVQKNSHSYSEKRVISRENKLFTSYSLPSWINDTTLITLKRGLADVQSVVELGLDGSERTIFHTGTTFPHSLHASNGKIVWSQLRPDPRWEHRNFAEIMLYDMQTGLQRQLTHKGRYFSPALSPDGSTIAAVRTSDESAYSLVLINSTSGEVIWEFSYADNGLILQPSWHPTGEKLAVVVLNDYHKRLDEITIGTRSVRTLFETDSFDISAPGYRGDDLVFHGTFSGIDNIYMLRAETHEPIKIVSSVFGAVHPAVHPITGAIAYADYTSDGYQISLIEEADFCQIPLSAVEDHSVAFHRTLARQESAVIGPGSIPSVEYTSRRYSKVGGLFQLHSWFPAWIDVSNTDIQPGASLLFQNKLSTSFAQLGYLWNLESQTGSYRASYTYRGWYPVVNIGAVSADRRSWYNDDMDNFLWKQNTFFTAFSLPLTWHANEYFYGISPLYRLGINRNAAGSQTPDSLMLSPGRYFRLAEKTYITHDFRFFAFRQRRTVARDIFPRFGQRGELHYRISSAWGDDMGSLFAARGRLFFPGVLQHHGISVIGGYQLKNRGERNLQSGEFSIPVNFTNILAYPRGYRGPGHKQLATLSFDYVLPLLHPDVRIPGIIYLKRVRTQLFYDYASAEKYPASTNMVRGVREEISSYGLELYNDVNLLGFVLPITLGVQAAFLLPESKPIFRFIYNMSF